jgi:hypothetical protein
MTTISQIKKKYRDYDSIFNFKFDEIVTKALQLQAQRNPNSTRINYISIIGPYFPFLTPEELSLTATRFSDHFRSNKTHYALEWKHRLPKIFADVTMDQSQTKQSTKIFDFVDMQVEDTTPIMDQHYVVTVASVDSDKLSCKYTVPADTATKIMKLITDQMLLN